MNTLASYRIDDGLLNNVNAGTFTPNKFPDAVYEDAGFTLCFHFFEKDQFVLDGKEYHEDEANAIMEKLGYRRYERTSKDGRQRTIEYWCKDRLVCMYLFHN